MNLDHLIAQGESATLEFKQSFDKEAIETVCAFANAKGGKVLIGVTDTAQIKGIEVSEETIQNYINQIKTQTEPGLIVDIDTAQVDGKSILIIHRDYTSPVDNQIKIFDQKITIFNPGKLYGDLTIEQLKTDSYPSRTRNKLIAEAFYLTGEVEKYGSGYQRIRNAIKDYTTMTFDYQESGDGFIVTIGYQQQKQSAENTEGVSGGVRGLLVYIETNPGLSAKQLSENLNLAKRTIERWLKQLKDQNQIEFRGAPKNGGYFKKHKK
jgi:predicted HTH transcriptional regulator